MKANKQCICGKNDLGMGVDDIRKWYRIPGAIIALAIPAIIPLIKDLINGVVLLAAMLVSCGTYMYFLIVTWQRMHLGHTLVCSLRYALLNFTRV
jgi:hypothetical protein